jgi:hypothetical protein
MPSVLNWAGVHPDSDRVTPLKVCGRLVFVKGDAAVGGRDVPMRASLLRSRNPGSGGESAVSWLRTKDLT